MTPQAAAAPAASKPAAAPKTPAAATAVADKALIEKLGAAPKASKKTSEVEKMNGRVLAFVEFARSTAKVLGDAFPGVDQRHAKLLSSAGAAFDEAVAIGGKVSVALLALHREKWTPPKPRRAGDWRVGDAVALKPKRVKRYVPAYEAADLASLTVVSAHGAMFKVQVLKDGLKGEMVGLVPGSWLKRAEPK